MHPTLVTIGDFTISTYEVAMTVAFLVAIFLAYRRAKKEGIDQGLVIDVCLWIVIGSLVGARVLFILTKIDDYMADPIQILKFWRGGLVYYGGLIGGAVAVWVVLHRRKQAFFPMADLLAPYLMLGYGIHRSLGCFMAGCCFGKPTDLPWGVVFPEGSAAATAYGPGVAVHPTQLYTGLAAFAIFGLLLWLRRRKPFPGAIAIALFLLYAVSRFTIEFFRGDLIRGFIGPLSTSQVISVGMAVVSVAWFIAARRYAEAKS
jgi:phosphatidylglycerol:prolipoprotein diacylglycerol transferase